MDFLPADPSIGQKYKINSDSAYYYEWNGFAWETVTNDNPSVSRIVTQKTAREIVNETPYGNVDSYNCTFELDSLPEENTEMLYLNGILQKEGEYDDYIISERSIQFNYPPTEGSILLCSYSTLDQIYSKNEEPKGSFDGNNNIFELERIPRIGYEKVYLNGVLQKYGENYDYIIDNRSIIFNEPPTENSTISCYYYSNI